MKTNYENVWHKACRRPKGSRSGKYPGHGQDRSLWSVIVWWLVSHVLILTVSCRLWVKTILGGAIIRLEQIWGGASITWLASPVARPRLCGCYFDRNMLRGPSERSSSRNTGDGVAFANKAPSRTPLARSHTFMWSHVGC